MAAIYTPTVVIGLGGTGKKIILSLKRMIAENSENGMADFPFLRFLCVDTDIKAESSIKSAIETLNESDLKLDKQKETFPLHVDFNRTPDLERDYPEIAAWFPKSKEYHLTPAELETGAGQVKPIGRFSLAWNANSLYTKLSDVLRNQVTVGNATSHAVGDNLDNYTNVFICGSVCGGTGSGTFLDTAYMVRHIAETTGRKVYIYGLFALSSMFGSAGGMSMIKTNCYASMKELDHFMNEYTFMNPKRRFTPAYRQFTYNYDISNGFPPFDSPFLFDNTNKSVTFDNPDQFHDMCARFIYLLTGSEVATTWKSMDNNIKKIYGQKYDKSKMEKPCGYRAMGAYSVLFPRRKVSQLCAYRLAKEYFKIALDDSYNPDEISRKAEYFLNLPDVKMSPNNTQLMSKFSHFTDSEGQFHEDFMAFINDQKDEMLESTEDKKEIVDDIKKWKSKMEEYLVSFKQQNSSTPRNVRENFLSELNKALAEMLNLKMEKDPANKDASGQEQRLARGSVVRTQKVVKKLYDDFKAQVEIIRKKADSEESAAKEKESDYVSALEDLDSAVGKIFSGKGKIQDRAEEVLTKCVEYIESKYKAEAYREIGQLLSGIVEQNVQKYPGIVAELEKLNDTYNKCIADFQELESKIDEKLMDGRAFHSESLCEILFDYKDDVEGSFNKLIENQKDDEVFKNLSVALQADDIFGPTYANISMQAANTIMKEILTFTEKPFFKILKDIMISQKVLNNPDALAKLLSGNYRTNAKVYLNYDEGEMHRVGLDASENQFFAITIPDEYQGKYCAGIKNDSCRGKKCPMEQDDTHKDEPCPMYNKCLKQLLLRDLPDNISLIPTSENAEINIINTLCGYPLHSVFTLTQDCSREYKQIYDKVKRDKPEEESVQMFGPLKLDEITEKSDDPSILANKFKNCLVFAMATGRLVVTKNTVDYVTQSDLQAGRRDNPSMHLGPDFTNACDLGMTTKAEEIKKVNEIIADMDTVKAAVTGNPEVKAQFAEKIKAKYDELKGNPAAVGITDKELDLLNEISKAICGQDLKPASAGPVLW